MPGVTYYLRQKSCVVLQRPPQSVSQARQRAEQFKRPYSAAENAARAVPGPCSCKWYRKHPNHALRQDADSNALVISIGWCAPAPKPIRRLWTGRGQRQRDQQAHNQSRGQSQDSVQPALVPLVYEWDDEAHQWVGGDCECDLGQQYESQPGTSSGHSVRAHSMPSDTSGCICWTRVSARTVASTHDDTLLATGGMDGHVSLWRPEPHATDRCVPLEHIEDVKHHGSQIVALDVCAADGMLLMCSAPARGACVSLSCVGMTV